MVDKKTDLANTLNLAMGELVGIESDLTSLVKNWSKVEDSVKLSVVKNALKKLKEGLYLYLEQAKV